MESEQFQVVYLEDFLGIASQKISIQLMQLIVSKDNDTAQYLKPMIQTLRGKTDQQNQAIIELVSTIMVYKFPELSRQEIQAMFTVSDLKKTKVYQEALDEGLEQGLERERSLIIRMLTKRVGFISEKSMAKIQTLSMDQAEALGEALLDFNGVQDLTTWLEQV